MTHLKILPIVSISFPYHQLHPNSYRVSLFHLFSVHSMTPSTTDSRSIYIYTLTCRV